MFKTPLRKRLYNHERYWSRPDVRLAQANYYRRQKGLPLLESPEQLRTNADRLRDERGRLVPYAS